jgi:hypothetical protein
MESNKDNRDILSWKRVIENIQNKADETVTEYNKAQQSRQDEAQLGIEDQDALETENYKVVVSSNDHGIIVDVYDKHDKQREPLKSDQYWDEDVMEGKVDEDLADIGNAVKKGFNKVKDLANKKIPTHVQKYGFKRPWLSVGLDNKIRSKFPGWNKGGAPLRSKPLEEGTWSIPETPEQVEKLTHLLKNPLDAATALDELYDVFGDDQLFDDLEVMKREEPETDVRHVVISRLKDMNFIKEVRENNQSQKVDEEYANEQHEQLEYIHHVLQECGDGNVDNAMIDQAIEFVEDIREQHFDDEGNTKSESVDEGYKVLPPMDDKYQARDGLEGPFTTLSGKVVYYDPKEGKYYDPDTDMYMSYDEWNTHNSDHSGMTEDAGYSDKQIKMAFGILNDPRYKGGNYSGAVKAIEKFAKGLSKHPSVANALKRANESVNEELEYSQTAEEMAKELGMSMDEFWELAERVGVDQYGGLTKDNYEDVTAHIVDNADRYKQIHIFRKAGEFDEDK